MNAPDPNPTFKTAPQLLPETRTAIFMAFLFLFTGLHINAASAQTNKQTGVLGIGAQVGTPTGLTLKRYLRQDASVIFLGSWSLERFLLFSAHVVYEYPIPDSPLRFFIGPGMEVGREGDKETSDIRISATVMPGLNFFTEKFEVFLQALPGVKVIPDVKFTLGGAVGLRYFF